MSDENNILKDVLLQAIKEQRASRRWKIFFRLLWLAIIIGLIIAFNFSNNTNLVKKTSPQVALVELKGEINREGNTYINFKEALEEALKDKNTVGVIIKANSPGGSPVYSNMIYEEILRLRAKYPKIPIDVVVEEVCASGCYYIASGAANIYASKASIIGSIGVIYEAFGLTGLMQKVGVDSRLLTSGINKAMGDPFTPINPQWKKMQQEMLDKIHAQFIQAVKQGRGKRLNQNSLDIFSGRYWIGEDGLKLGLIDGFATVDSLARDLYKSDNIVNFTKKEDPFEKISKKIGAEVSNASKQALGINMARFY